MADKIPSEVRTLALSLHTDLTTLNTYADKPDVVAALVPIIFDKIRGIGNAAIAVADAAGIAPRGWDKVEAGTDQAA